MQISLGSAEEDFMTGLDGLKKDYAGKIKKKKKKRAGEKRDEGRFAYRPPHHWDKRGEGKHYSKRSSPKPKRRKSSPSKRHSSKVFLRPGLS